MSIGAAVAFTPVNSAAATTAPVLTVPAGVLSTYEIVVAASFVSGVALTATYTTSGSGTLTQRYAALQGTSAYGFVFEGTGFVAGDTITITPSANNRNVAVGVAYPGAAYETVGATPGATSTTVANAPSVAAANNGDLALACSFGIASSTGRTFSSRTAGWTQRTFIQGGSSTRFPMVEIADLPMPASGATGAEVATASAALLSSSGIQLVLSATATVAGDNPGWGIGL